MRTATGNLSRFLYKVDARRTNPREDCHALVVFFVCVCLCVTLTLLLKRPYRLAANCCGWGGGGPCQGKKCQDLHGPVACDCDNLFPELFPLVGAASREILRHSVNRLLLLLHSENGFRVVRDVILPAGRRTR